MLIRSVHVRNFRSIQDEKLSFENLTALVGANGSGKSSFLHAIELFYDTLSKIQEEDFYNSDMSEEIAIAIEFSNLTDDELKLFSNYVQDSTLTVEKVFRYRDGKIESRYHGASLRNPDFNELRDCFEIGAAVTKQKYNELLGKTKYSTLPKYQSLATTKETLIEWESENHLLCARQRDDGQFFGFKEVAQGYLGRHTKFLYIPAVRQAAEDAEEGKGSILTKLMDLVVRASLLKRTDVMDFQTEMNTKYKQIIDPLPSSELKSLAKEMTKTLQDFVPNASIGLGWLPVGELEIPFPKADIKLIEDGYESTVSRTGHGLQRAFIMTMLKHLSLAEVVEKNDENATQRMPDLILVIEEPELYQHPNRQRHMARILQKLSTTAKTGVLENTQIIYSTHSPHFVSMDSINQLRLLRKVSVAQGKPKVTRIWRTTIDDVTLEVKSLAGSTHAQYTSSTVLPRLKSIMTAAMSEGFFADTVVLVEGEDDRAAIHEIARIKGCEFESVGISVLACHGKGTMDRPIIVFRKLGIPVYAIWDNDEGKGVSPKNNHLLLKLMNRVVTDWPVAIEKEYTCLKTDLESVLRSDIGAILFGKYLGDCQSEFGIPDEKQAIKNPVVIATIIKKAYDNGQSCPTIERAIDSIVALKAG